MFLPFGAFRQRLLEPREVEDIYINPSKRKKGERYKRKAARLSKRVSAKKTGKRTVRTKGKKHSVRGGVKRKKAKTRKYPYKKKR
jgi:hypothetical protein